MIEVKLQQQPTPRTCAHTCLSMVTGVPVEDLIERFGDRGLAFPEEACVLIENGIFPVNTTGSHHEFALEGVYLVSTPSLNLPGKLHMVVVEASADGYVVYDPNTGREGVKAYHPNAIMDGELARCEVRYLDTQLLSGIKGPETAELAQVKRKLEEAEALIKSNNEHMDAYVAMARAGQAQAAKVAAYQIRDRLTRVLDRELDERALELIEDIATEYSLEHTQAKEEHQAERGAA